MPATRSAGGGHARLQAGFPAVTLPDDDPAASAAYLGVLPVDVVDVVDSTAPASFAAFRTLGGRSLLVRAVETLASSAAVRRVVVAVPADGVGLVRSDLADLAAGTLVPVDVVSSSSSGLGRLLLDALGSPVAEQPDDTPDDTPDTSADIVVVHEPLFPMSPAALVGAVVQAVAGAADVVAAVPARRVTDTLKWVDHGEVVRDTADRERYRLIGSPQAYRMPALRAALAGAPEEALADRGPDVLPRLVAADGGRLALVPFGGELLRIGSQDDLLLAEALLEVEAEGARLRRSGPGAPSATVRLRRGRADR